MKLINQPILWAGSETVTVTGTVNSDPLDLSNILDSAFRIEWDGGVTGETWVEAAVTRDTPDATDWTIVPASDQATLDADGAGSHLIQILNTQYNWVRISFRRDSGGTPTLSGIMNSKNYSSFHQ